MDKECDLKKKVSHLENIGRKVCLDLRNYQKERIILSREAKCLLREIEKGQSRRRYGKKKHYSKSACTCAIWENSLKTDGRSDENEEDLTSDNGCGCCHNSDQENYCKDSFEICKCSSSKYNTLSEPFENTQPVTIVNDNDDDDDLDDDSDDDSDCINNNDVNQDNIDDTHHELRSNETCTTNPVPLCKMCLFCKANNIHHKFNVNNKSDTGDWIERQRGGGEKTDSESTNDNTPNLSNCICNCDICALRNKHGGRPPCCVQENEQLDHTIDDDYDENLQSSQTVLSEISEIHQYCKITKLREALEKLKNRNHTLRKLLKQRECALPNSMMQQATCNFCSIPGNNCDNNNNVNDCINHRVECKETTRDLVAILKILQSKCRIKDGMIVILADELKDCATNERLKRILDKLTEANIDCGIVDFDRSTLWKYLVSNTKPVHIIKQYCSQRKSIVGKKAQCNEITIGVIILSCIFFINIYYRYRYTIMFVFRAISEALYRSYEILQNFQRCFACRNIIVSITENCTNFCDMLLSLFNCRHFVMSIQKLTSDLASCSNDGFPWLSVIFVCVIILILFSYRTSYPFIVMCTESMQHVYDTCSSYIQNVFE